MSDENRTVSLHPEFLKRMQKMLGNEYEDFIKSYEAPRTYGLRVNTAKISCEEFEKIVPFPVTPIPWIPNGYFYPGDVRPSFCPLYQAGLYYLQEPSAMTPAARFPVEPGERVLDLCAAPGGKAIHLAEKLSGTGYVEARDLTEYKVALIEENIERSGLDNIEAVCQDATINDEASYEKADILIADLPCSGLGILGKKPDLKSKMTVEMAKGLADLQRQILTVVHNYVKPGGKLLYSTCTINREENEDNTAWFVENFPEFEKIREKQMLPGSDMGDGFYIAEFRKQ